jgi:hypothetical protein
VERQLTVYIAHIATTDNRVTSAFDAKYGIHVSSGRPTTDTVMPQRLVPALRPPKKVAVAVGDHHNAHRVARDQQSDMAPRDRISGRSP